MPQLLLGFWVTLLLCASLSGQAKGKNYALFSNGKSDYMIVVSSQASESEKYAATELQSYLKIIGGVFIPIVNSGEGVKGKRIIIGYNQDYKRLFCVEKERSHEDESFTYKSKKGDIVIIGGKDRGTMYGVFAFLENELGCRWLAEDCTIIPSRNDYSFTKLDYSETPAFLKRSIWYNGIRSELFSVQRRINERIRTSPSGLPKQIGGVYGFLSPHTMGYLLPVEKYFASNPECFALIDGKRVKDNTQPCFSEAKVLEICVEELKKLMRKYPAISIYQVSALDNGNRCHCPRCENAIKKMGNYTDLVLDFVNHVADAIKDEFPEKKIEFLAYWTTRTPPITITPHDNVVVRLSNIEICHIHGYESCSSDASELFRSDIKRWLKISKELYIGEYASNFSLFYIPTPNFYALRDNLEAYQKNGIKCVFIEGEHDANNSELRALRIYVLTKLLWNPECNVDEVVNDFMMGYYEDAAPYMKEYFNLIHSYIREDTHLRPFAGYGDSYYSKSLFEDASNIFKKAKKATSDEKILKRIETEELSIMLYKSVCMTKEAQKDGTYDNVRKIIEQGRTKIGSKNTEDYIRKALNLR